MGQKEKLIQRLKTRPRDFTFEEAETLLRFLGYTRFDKGRTSGSRVAFVREGSPPLLLHKPCLLYTSPCCMLSFTAHPMPLPVWYPVL